MGVWAIPVVFLVGFGLVCALAVLLRTPVVVPFKTSAFVDKAFLEADHGGVLDGMLASVVVAERSTRKANKAAAVLVNLSLSAFVAASVVLAFQVGIGARGGLAAGLIAAVVVVGSAWLLRYLTFMRN